MSGLFHSHIVLIEQTAIDAVLAMSVQVALRTGVFSFAGIGFFGVGAYAGANLIEHLNGAAVLILVTVACAIFGYILSLPLVRLRALYLGMATFAFVQILAVVAVNGGGITGGALGRFGIPRVLSTWELFVITGVCALTLAVFERGALGRSLQMIRVDERLAQSAGLNVAHARSVVFGISAALGALAGMMRAFTFGTITPADYGFDLVVAGLTMAVIGGVSSWRGALIGAIVIAWSPEIFSSAGRYHTVAFGVLIVAVVMFEPDGVMGIVNRCLSAIRRVRRRGRDTSSLIRSGTSS